MLVIVVSLPLSFILFFDFLVANDSSTPPFLNCLRQHRNQDLLNYSAARTCRTGPTRAAQYLNSGILPKGSSIGLVSALAGLSLKQKGMNTMPSATSRSARRMAW